MRLPRGTHEAAVTLRAQMEREMIVQAAMTMLVLLGLGAFVVDYGVLWVGRAQAQNAADAGALAAGDALAYDDTRGSSITAGIVFGSAHQTLLANPVWSQPVVLGPLG